MNPLSLDEIKDMIKFCKSEKVKSLKIGYVIIELSDYAFLEAYEQTAPQKEEKISTKTLVDTEEQMTPEEYDSLLYHSSNP